MVALDRGTSPYVTMATFAKAMSLYLRGDLEERITYAFTVSVALVFYTLWVALDQSHVAVRHDGSFAKPCLCKSYGNAGSFKKIDNNHYLIPAARQMFVPDQGIVVQYPVKNLGNQEPGNPSVGSGPCNSVTGVLCCVWLCYVFIIIL